MKRWGGRQKEEQKTKERRGDFFFRIITNCSCGGKINKFLENKQGPENIERWVVNSVSCETLAMRIIITPNDVCFLIGLKALMGRDGIFIVQWLLKLFKYGTTWKL